MPQTRSSQNEALRWHPFREIARAAGIQQPGLYDYFESKEVLYSAVLDFALAPLSEGIDRFSLRATPDEFHSTLAGVMTDLLIEHPNISVFFQRALQGDSGTLGNHLIKDWLDLSSSGRPLRAYKEAGLASRPLSPKSIACSNASRCSTSRRVSSCPREPLRRSWAEASPTRKSSRAKSPTRSHLSVRIQLRLATSQAQIAQLPPQGHHVNRRETRGGGRRGSRMRSLT